MTSYMMTGAQVDYSGQNHLITLTNSNLLNYLDDASLGIVQIQNTLLDSFFRFYIQENCKTNYVSRHS